MFDLTGKTALITGASGGIGGAIAAALHAAGATVALTGTREAPLRERADQLGAGAHVREAAFLAAAAHVLGQAAAIVGHGDAQARLGRDAHVDAPRAGVAAGVVDRLLHDAEQGDPGHRVQRVGGALAVVLHLDLGAAGRRLADRPAPAGGTPRQISCPRAVLRPGGRGRRRRHAAPRARPRR